VPSLLASGAFTQIAAIALAAVAGAFLTLAIMHSLTLRRLGRRARTDARELERLRDEVWELRAAAEARERAEAASKAKSRFLATVSHEVRTPLNGILGMADLLTATSIDDEQKSYVEAIRASGQSLGSLIEDLLDLSRIEAGKLDVVSEPFAIAPLVEGVVELLAPRAQAKGLEIASFIAPDVPPDTTGDAARLRQVLLNVAGNAVKFTERGGVGLRVEHRAGALLIRVIDTGPGVPFDRRDSIFEDFEQADEAVAREHGGTGLGLAISRRLIERMGGRLWLAESSEKGSTFALSLPLAADANAAPPEGWIAGQSVLIASAAHFEAPFIGEQLAARGAAVAYARSAAEALASLQDHAAPDVAIVDCGFGEAATVEIAAAARKAGARRLFVLFSPMQRRALRSDTLREFDGWLVKPVRAKSLLERLAPRASHTASAGHGTHMSMPRLEGVRILLAEDNEISRLVALKQLERHGARVTCAGDGIAAVRLARDEQFDAILLDIRMPGLDGLAAARQIRAAKCMAPLVALTANAFQADRRAATEAGIDYFLAKPVNPSDLIALIETALTQSKRADALPRAS
jgi:signal transduction histidine kinase/CheY-like chemotaxis protein